MLGLILSFQSENKPYIETYLSVNGNGLSYQSKANGTFQAQLAVVVEFLQENNVIKVDKYNLSSPEIKDTSLIDFVFRSTTLSTLGDYTLSLNITDNNKNNEEIKHEQAISIKSINNSFQMFNY